MREISIAMPFNFLSAMSVGAYVRNRAHKGSPFFQYPAAIFYSQLWLLKMLKDVKASDHIELPSLESKSCCILDSQFWAVEPLDSLPNGISRDIHAVRFKASLSVCEEKALDATNIEQLSIPFVFSQICNLNLCGRDLPPFKMGVV